ncbi:unnamed protein product [Sphagnum jensenii]|jgi:hypothetical protein|uniref:Uncharacterized protein n=1 Tax=Sphagnum jensenii TaxID=128206 RepID=A0ABP0VID9_9BRYO
MNNQEHPQGGKTLLTLEVKAHGIHLTTHPEAMAEKLQELKELKRTSSENIWFTDQGSKALIALFLVEIFATEKRLSKMLYEFYESFDPQEMLQLLDHMDGFSDEIAQ